MRVLLRVAERKKNAVDVGACYMHAAVVTCKNGRGTGAKRALFDA